MDVLNSREDILKLIREALATRQIEDYEITEVIPNEKGEGFLGEVFRITIKNKGRELKLIIKSAFTLEEIRSAFPIRSAFQNETLFYNKLYSLYAEIDPEIRTYVPECYGTSNKEHQEILILENVQPKGFECFSKKNLLQGDHFSLIFKTYGKFHGYSAVMKRQNPEQFQEFSEQFINIFGTIAKSSSYGEHQKFLNDLASEALIPGEDDEVIKAFEKHSGIQIVESMKKATTEVDDFCLFLHGDCWSNNMLFKYEGQTAKQITLIDFQLVRLGSPVCDLAYCLYSGGSKPDFDKLDHYLQIYHDSFSAFVRKFGEDPDKLYPFAALQEHWRKYAIFGYCMSIGIIKLKLTNKENIKDFTDAANSDNFAEDVKNVKFDRIEYQRRIRDLLLHLHDVKAL